MASQRTLLARLREVDWPVRLGQLGVVLLALWTRWIQSRSVLVDGVVHPPDGDSAYHLRRILQTVDQPSYPGLFDPLMNWPTGSISMWSPGQDWLGTAFVYLLGAQDDPSRAAHAAALLPVLLGTLMVAAVMALARQLRPDRPAVWVAAGLFAALLPQNVVMSQMGRTDHHASEMLAVALLCWWSVALLPSADRPPNGFRRRLAFELCGALLLAGAVWTATISLVFAGIAAALRMGTALLRPSANSKKKRSWRDLVGSGSPALLLAACLLAIAYAPAVGEHGQSWSYAYPSYLQPLLLALGSLGCGFAVASTWLFRSASPTEGRHILHRGLFVGAGVAVGAGLMALSPAVRGALHSGLFDYMGSQDAWLARIVELRPLLDPEPSWLSWDKWVRFEDSFGPTGFAIPVVVPLAILAAARTGKQRGVVLGVWLLTLLLLTLAQLRWGRALGVVLAVAAALSLGWIVDRLVAKAEDRSEAFRRRVSSGLVIAVSLVLLLSREPAWLLQGEVAPHRVSQYGAARFLRDQPRAAESGQRSGVLVRWDYAWVLLALSGKPVLSGGFGSFAGADGFADERRVWHGTHRQLWALMQRRDLGYVVAGLETMHEPRAPDGSKAIVMRSGQPALNLDYMRHVPLAPLLVGGTALPELDVPHLEHLCPVYVGPEFHGGLPFPLPTLWVYEWVAGATLRGHAEPSSRMVVELLLRHAGGVVSYFAYGQADDAGHVAIRFPIPTNLRTDTLQASRTVRIHREGAAMVRLEIPVAAVQAGEEIAIPYPEPPTR